ncbi:hypothetical protein [Roseiconus nitratireducens]|nr:hypothetical protein [Roseiconus nitratireducens]
MPRQQPLTALEGQNLFFALKVIDRSERVGRLLGIAENIRPESTGDQTLAGRKGILPVERRPLGQQLWRLEYGEHDVFLLVNQDVAGLSESIGSDPLMYAVVYPEVVRQILTQAIQRGGDPDADDDTWSTLWLSFGLRLHPDHINPPSMDELDAVNEWIEMVVDAFCNQHSLRDRFVQGDLLSRES